MLYSLINDNLPDYAKRYCDFTSDTTISIINALEASWIQGTNSLSIPYYQDTFGAKSVSRIIYALAESEWIISSVIGRFGTFKLNLDTLSSHLSTTEQDSYRTKSRIAKYRLKCVEEIQPSNLTKTPNGTVDTGLDRPGFAKCANEKFSLDTKYMVKYHDAIKANAVKSMEKMAKRYPDIAKDHANYGVIVSELIDWHTFNPDAQFNMEANVNDQRGRAIYTGLRRVFNPIASKDARAMLVADRGVVVSVTNQAQMDDIHLFIAELIGTKASTWEAKKLIGMDCYNTRDLHTLDLTNAKDRKELHENIWLERIYAKLDLVHANGYALWDIPLEMDYTMSMGLITGILYNDERLINSTNGINPEDLRDAWETDPTITRAMNKAVGTPRFYGSGQTAKALLKSNGLECTKAQLRTINKEFTSGRFAVMVAAKDFMIKHANISTPTYDITAWDETYTTTVNKFKVVGATVNAYSAYDSVSGTTKAFINHSTVRIPDYEQFRAYHQTSLIHNIDSRLMDKLMQAIQAHGEWAIAIHDAGLVLPGTAIRAESVTLLEELRTKRHTILNNVRKSIGATGPAADIAWARLHSLTHQLPTSTPLSGAALK